MKNKENRIIYLDLLKIFSIFSMIVIHVSASFWVKTSVFEFNWHIYNIYDSLVRFCVPVFFMISGVLLLEPRKKYSLYEIFNRYIIKTVRVFLIWSFIYALISKNANTEFSEFLYFVITGHFHLWYLYALVGIYLILPFLRNIAQNKVLLEYFLILSFIFTIMLTFLKANAQTAELFTILEQKSEFYFAYGYTGYFLLGYYLNKIEFTPKLRKLIYVLGIISVFITIIATAFLSIKARKGIDTYYSYFMPNVYFVAVAVFIFFKRMFSKIQLSSNTSQTVNLLANLSLGAYLSHDLVNIAFNKIGLTASLFNPILSVPIISILVFIISYLIAYLISKIPILNKYII